MYQYTHLIAEAKSKFSSNLKPYAATHDIIDTIEAFHQLSFNYFTIPPVKIKTKPVLFILKRRENYKELLQISQESVEDDYVEESDLSNEEHLKIVEKMERHGLNEEQGSSEDEENEAGIAKDYKGGLEHISEENPSDTFDVDATTEDGRNEETDISEEDLEKMGEKKVKSVKRQKMDTKVEKEEEKMFKKLKYLKDEEMMKDEIELEDVGLRSKKIKSKEASVSIPPKLSLEESEDVPRKLKIKIKSEDKKILPKLLKKKTEQKEEDIDSAEQPEQVRKRPIKDIKLEVPKPLKKVAQDEEDIGTTKQTDEIPKRPTKEIKFEVPKPLKRRGEESAKEFDKPLLKPAKPLKQVTSLALSRKGAESRQNVKQNIRKIIQEFKREHLDEQFPAQPQETIHAKETIKKIIAEERSKQERDEINKIQQQIMDIIESNPNIINKELIKSKLQETIINELVNAIDHKILETGTKTKKIDEGKKSRELSRRLPETEKKSVIVEKPSPLKELKKELSKEQPTSKISMEDYIKSDEDYEPGEVDNAINLYDSPKSTSEYKSKEALQKTSKPEEEHILDEDKLAFIKRFKKANEKLDNILTIIDEIVDTIEITDEDDEDSFR